MPGQQVLGGNLARGVDRREMAREPAHDRQPLTPIVRVRARRHARPLERQLGGDPLSARPLEELHEPFQQPAVLGHLEPEPATEAQIVSQRFAKRHAAPPSCDGHGRASARSALRSTLAYIAVVFCSRWRNTWPISASDAPALSISVAAVCRNRCAPTRGSPARVHASRTIHPIVCGPAPKRRGHPQEQRPALAPRAAAKIGHQRFTNVDRQRQHVLPGALAANQQLAARQSTSSSWIAATSPARSPSRESNSTIA